MAKKDPPAENQKSKKKNSKRSYPPKLKEYNDKKKEAYTGFVAEAIKIMDNMGVLKPKMGRPSKYTPELAEYIIKKIATSPLGLKAICESDDKMPDSTTINEWRWDYPDFSRRYLEAKQMQAHLLAEQCEEIAAAKHFVEDALGQKRVDPGFIASQRLMADTRKWHLAKLNPTYYGDKKLVDEMRNKNDELLAELQSIRAQLAEKNKKEF